ncbi:hypothetical protein CVT26_010887 [Gymnopilus dilepis]|uniref:Glucose-methanol-choline oxidoreductase N-terminal domain-containing protein n=1 Tax=Gymnopilus dilepis TaxID=231916 RepID=A0A409VIR3_9AGAR|nr:hypothetical protein CVT26_010887 [Gymnopilus dilepis]
MFNRPKFSVLFHARNSTARPDERLALPVPMRPFSQIPRHNRVLSEPQRHLRLQDTRVSANIYAKDAFCAFWGLVAFPNADVPQLDTVVFLGGSRVNYSVYKRGTGEYNRWKEMDHSGWRYEELEPLFAKPETTFVKPESYFRGKRAPWKLSFLATTIGPRMHSKRFDIKVVYDLPGIDCYLADHPGVHMLWGAPVKDFCYLLVYIQGTLSSRRAPLHTLPLTLHLPHAVKRSLRSGQSWTPENQRTSPKSKSRPGSCGLGSSSMPTWFWSRIRLARLVCTNKIASENGPNVGMVDDDFRVHGMAASCRAGVETHL